MSGDAPGSLELGRTGVRVSPLGIGAGSWGQPRWGFGQSYGRAEVVEAFEASVRGGVTFFDTAEVYGDGASERFLGELRVTHRAEGVVLATKYAPKVLTLRPRLTRGAFRRALAASLERLGVERVALYQIHWQSPIPPVSSLMEAMAEAVAEGKIQAVGVSNYDAKHLRIAHEALGKRGIPLASNQVAYSLLNRTAETNGVMAACRELGVSLIAHTPLAQGLLSGKYRPGALPSGPRPPTRIFEPANVAAAVPVVGLLAEIGRGHGGKSPEQVALNWLMQQPGVLPIPGAKNGAQARSNVGALGWSLTKEEIATIDAATARWRT
ncbi:aldo/keto reductase [Sorangium sp. So ce1151]|uniref:aldo/keto reductase n=1 Tax=Sorangium sp. So ce1151 TaxID=3133332 RepID=UPI003F60FFE7